MVLKETLKHINSNLSKYYGVIIKDLVIEPNSSFEKREDGSSWSTVTCTITNIKKDLFISGADIDEENHISIVTNKKYISSKTMLTDIESSLSLLLRVYKVENRARNQKTTKKYTKQHISDYQKRLTQQQANLLIKHCNTFDIKPDICAWYDDMQDFYTDWIVDNKIYPDKESARERFLDGREKGEFKVFKDGSIVRLVI